VVKELMPTSTPKTFKSQMQGHKGFSLIEILVALLLASLIFLITPGNEQAQKHRDLKGAVENLDRSVRFAANEAILRNTVVRLRLSLDEDPTEYTVEYGPPGNLPLPEMAPDPQNLSLAEQKAAQDKATALDQQFTKVEEFEEIKQTLPNEVSIEGVASTAQKGIEKSGEVSIYFYPTGEKDGALIFFSTSQEMAYLELAPFLSETTNVFIPFDPTSVAKITDILQTKMDEVYKEWGH
jgi:prepilin-type N-terminal cleavage/methylation domain-containing protein